MYVINADSADSALDQGMDLLLRKGVARDSRNGPVLEVPTPVTTVYSNPRNRVLFNGYRNKNHAFELMESLWILAGCFDVARLSDFNSNMANYSDGGYSFHGAYGYRMRYTQDVDQIQKVVYMLKEDPATRRAVISIWDTKLDLATDSKDIPCNDMIFFKIRDGALHITVANRSNDIIWGTYGTNIVQFSMLQEYVAAHIGVNVGTYAQVSDSFHAYINAPAYQRLIVNTRYSSDNWDWYERVMTVPHAYPMVNVRRGETPSMFDDDLQRFVRMWQLTHIVHEETGDLELPEYRNNNPYKTHFFQRIVLPMFCAFLTRDEKLLQYMPTDSDWRMGAEVWFRHRETLRGVT